VVIVLARIGQLKPNACKHQQYANHLVGSFHLCILAALRITRKTTESKHKLTKSGENTNSQLGSETVTTPK